MVSRLICLGGKTEKKVHGLCLHQHVKCQLDPPFHIQVKYVHVCGKRKYKAIKKPVKFLAHSDTSFTYINSALDKEIPISSRSP